VVLIDIRVSIKALIESFGDDL